MALHIGIGLFTAQVPPDSPRTFVQEYREIVDLARLAETLGFESAWVSEHHGSGDGYMPSLLPTLAAFAAATEHIKLGTGVVLTPFHHPLRLAEDAAMVDLISGGRLILGLGLGWREEEFRMFGVPLSERVRRTVETIEILRQAWTGRRFSYQGKSFSFAQLQNTFAWDEGDAWEVVGKYVGNQLGIYRGWDKGGDTPGQGFLLDPPEEATMRWLTPAGTSQEVGHALRPMVEAFAGRKEFHLIVRLHYPGMDFETASRAMELFAERVI